MNQNTYGNMNQNTYGNMNQNNMGSNMHGGMMVTFFN
jgi:hypothetical protein